MIIRSFDSFTSEGSLFLIFVLLKIIKDITKKTKSIQNRKKYSDEIQSLYYLNRFDRGYTKTFFNLLLRLIYYFNRKLNSNFSLIYLKVKDSQAPFHSFNYPITKFFKIEQICQKFNTSQLLFRLNYYNSRQIKSLSSNSQQLALHAQIFVLRCALLRIFWDKLAPFNVELNHSPFFLKKQKYIYSFIFLTLRLLLYFQASILNIAFN